MNRRQALHILATGAALQLAPERLFAVLKEARAALGAPAALRTMNPHQDATVISIADLIIPRTDTPGATDVGVDEFIDLILTEWYTDDERNFFLKGLASVDQRTQELFGKDFVDCSRTQQEEILRDLGEQMSEAAEAVRNHARPYRGALPGPEENFYYMLRNLVLTGYYTSEEGATQELHFQIVPASHEGCATISEDTSRQTKNL